MQEFFQEIEELRGIISQIEQDIGRVRQVQNDILTCPQVDQKAKQQLEDIMNDIKKKANSGKILSDLDTLCNICLKVFDFIKITYNILNLSSPNEAQEIRTNQRTSRTGGHIFASRITNAKNAAGMLI